MHVVRCRPARIAAHLCHTAAGGRVHGAHHNRSRVQPSGRFQPDDRARRTRDVRAEAGQRGATCVRLGRATVQGVPAQVHRTAQGVRPGRSRSAVPGVRQQAFH